MISIESLDLRGNEIKRNSEPCEEIEVEEVKLFGKGDDRSVRISKNLSKEFKQKFISLLKGYHVCFAWSAADMLGIDPKIACHKLAINPSFKPVQQKKRKHGLEWPTAIIVEVDKLLKVGFIEEAPHITWLANVVMVKKANNSWTICIDFTDLNKAYPKDSYLLPIIDNLVDSTLSYTILSFCVAFFGYNRFLCGKKTVS